MYDCFFSVPCFEEDRLLAGWQLRTIRDLRGLAYFDFVLTRPDLWRTNDDEAGEGKEMKI